MLMNPVQNFRGRRLLFAVAIGWVAQSAAPSVAVADEAAVTTILGGLQTPCAVAVRPEGGQPSEVFVADRGAGRVVRVVANRPDVADEVITGFPINASDSDKPNSPGIQSLFFLDHLRLVVAGGDAGGKPFIRLYELQDLEGVLRFDEHKQTADPPADDDHATNSIRSFHDLARTRPNDRVADALLMAAAGEHGPAGLWKVAVRANTIGEIAPIDAAKESEHVAAIGGIAIANAGYIVIAADAESGAEHHAALKFLNPVDGRVALQIQTELPNIVGLAYSPTTGNLYAANYAPENKSADGIYRLDDAGKSGKPACRATKIAATPRPTALAFGPDGTLYVTALGRPDEKNHNSGALLKVEGGL